MANSCKNVVIDYTKPKHYSDKDWLKLEELGKKCSGKVKKFRSANDQEFTEVKKGILNIGGSPVMKNDKGIWGCDYQTKDGKHCVTATYVDGMVEPFGNFNVIKRSNNKLLKIKKGSAYK